MILATFLIGIVLALTIGFGAAVFWYRSRQAVPVDRPNVAEDFTRPIADALVRLEAEIRDVERQRQHMLGGLDRHLTSLSKETTALSQALRAPNSRGRWGELTLRRVAELSGMAPHCDFFEQQPGEGMRPDMLVALPGGRTIAVDAKVPFSAYLDAEAATDDAAKRTALVRHAQQVARHAAQLGAREYWTQLQPAPEFVVLFLAGEHFLSAALEHDPELLEKALAKRVLLATPVTLVSVLKGVSYTWRQERLAKNAEELRQIAGEFYDRARAFADFYSDSGRHLARAMEAYNRSVASWDARLQPSLKKMRELGVGGAADVPALPTLDAAAREPKPLERPFRSEPRA